MSAVDHGRGAEPRRKRKGGRPRSISPRKMVFVVRANAGEAAEIKQAAATARLPVAIFLRHRALGLPVVAPMALSDVQTATALGRIGHNINQAVKLLHKGGPADWPAAQLDELQRTCADLAIRIAMAGEHR